MATVEIVSFGYLHGVPPKADLTLDLRRHFRDPHVSPDLRNLTAHDTPVQQAVASTPGIMELVRTSAYAVRAFAKGPSTGTVVVAVGCAGGRHRAPVFASALADWLRMDAFDVTVTDLDLSKPVVTH